MTTKNTTLPNQIVWNFGGDKKTAKQALPEWAFKQVQDELRKIKNPPELIFYGEAEVDPDDQEDGMSWLDSLYSRVSEQFYSCECCDQEHLNEVQCCGDEVGDLLQHQMIGDVLKIYQR